MPTATPTAVPVETPASTRQADVAEAVRTAYESSEAIFLVGGGTALDYGNPPSCAGRSLDLTVLNRMVDYTPRDMTIVVEAGVRMADLSTMLAAEGQHLPIDVPRAAEATIGGVVATNWNGPRRYGHGTIRDYVIGINAVDGRGTPFKGGGRVVKNVAGYDFCKLLTGSLGTLAVITQVALRLKPVPEQSALMACSLPDVAAAEKLLAALVTSQVTPTAIELLAGPEWQDT